MSHHSTASLLLLAIALMGCSREPFEPSEGPWDSVIDAIEDGCESGLDDDIEVGEEGRTILKMDADGDGFTLRPDVEEDEEDDTAPAVCTLQGREFSCEVEGVEDIVEDQNPEGVDKIISVTYDIGGEFGSETEATYFVAFDADCEGTQCWDSEATFPCTSSVFIELEAQ